MKKLSFLPVLFILGICTTLSNTAQAQRKRGGGDDGAFGVGTTTVGLGIGVGRSPWGGGLYGGYTYDYGTGLGLKATIEHGFWQLGPGVLSLGLEAGGSFTNARFTGYDYNGNIVIAAARAAYHYGFNLPNFDAYAGLSLGPGFRSYYDGDREHDLVVAPGAFVGAAYYFSPNFGVNVEAGYDITVIQGGIIFKF